MGYFFRKSARIGPFRLNFSKSGIGASVGVKGARVTMNARGTTYVTVGSNGFYYRETLSSRGRSAQTDQRIPPPIQPQATRDGEKIASADISELVDSSSEKLIQQLNERAHIFNPSWIIYAAAVGLAIAAISISTETATTLPDVTSPLSEERSANIIDEYPILVARYGNPDSITNSGSDAPIRTAKAFYRPDVSVILVPNGCIDAYQTAKHSVPSDQTELCVPSKGWAIVGYFDDVKESWLTNVAAAAMLERIHNQRLAEPVVEVKTSEDTKGLTTAKGSKKGKSAKGPNGSSQTTKPKPTLQPDTLDPKVVEETKQRIQSQTSHGIGLRVLLILSSFAGFIIGGLVHQSNSQKRQTRLVYDLGPMEKQRFATIQQALTHLAQCQRIWRLESRSQNPDWKRNAGASSLVRRTLAHVSFTMPPRVECNVPASALAVGGMRLFFLPDIILCLANGRYGSIAYRDFTVEQSVTRFIEEEGVPRDAIVVDRTWRYVNKGGGPDRRFNNNVQIPIAQYGVIVLSSSTGLNIHLNTSSTQHSAAFTHCWNGLQGRDQSPPPDFRRQQSPPRPSPPPNTPPPPRARTDAPLTPRASALKLFGLSETASTAEITAAYYRLAQQCHPDKVAGLAPEFQALAEVKMKELNAAYRILNS